MSLTRTWLGELIRIGHDVRVLHRDLDALRDALAPRYAGPNDGASTAPELDAG